MTTPAGTDVAAGWPIEPPPNVWAFPDPSTADGDLVIVGADLEPGTILAAYRKGLFPMPLATPGIGRRGGARSQLGWWSPDPRGILPLDGLVVTKSLRRSLRRFEIRVDTAFDEVVVACADPRRTGAWITDEVRAAYRRLHDLGWAHSVEAWSLDDGSLAGGLYGLNVGGLFAGESMFHRVTDASKVALVALVELLRTDGTDRLLDVQWVTDHLATLGAIPIRRDAYLALLANNIHRSPPSAFGANIRNRP
ncbi:MAG TPA: leucyl/phenylalanyl-tRNA--protein transferase [Acidimicrobiales bacterium]